MRLPRPSGGCSCDEGAPVEMLSVREVPLTALPPFGLKAQLASDGMLLCRQLYVTGKAVVLLLLLTKPFVPVTVS